MKLGIMTLVLGMVRATDRRGVFCCKTELNYTRFGNPDCGRHDLVYVGARRLNGRPRWSQAQSIEFALSVLSNVAFAPPIWMLARRGRICDVVTATALAASSTAYHACEIAQIEFMRMNAGNWHRLDNVFSILSFSSLVPLLMGRANSVAPTQEQLDFCRWTVLVIGLFFQELNPWHIACMLAPIAYAFFFYVAWAKRHAPTDHWRRLCSGHFMAACTVQLASLACFARGLDQASDPFRSFHATWHVLNALSAGLFTTALDPLPEGVAVQHPPGQSASALPASKVSNISPLRLELHRRKRANGS